MKAALLALFASGCTVLAPATTASTIFSHNIYTDSADRWSYKEPLAIAAVAGLLFDIFVTGRIISAATATRAGGD